MRYLSFKIKNYRAIGEILVRLDERLIPLVGINECGKTTILQAIYAFDSINDDEYEGRRLNSIQDLYQTINSEASITAKILLSPQYVIQLLDIISAKISKGMIIIKEEDFPFLYESATAQKLFGTLKEEIEIEIKRNLNNKKYSTTWDICDFLKNETVNREFCEELLSRLPYILYNDDFADRPPSEVIIPVSPPKMMSGWLAVYERLFQQTSPNYSLFSLISETDSRRRSSIISDVESHLNSTLSAAWKNFSTEKKNVVNVSLEILDGDGDKKLAIQIVEQLDGKNRYFNILDRSKGFVWYFNFIMKTRFNPKIAGEVKDTIFLLDEPGSYLHSSAQEKLSDKLKEIYQKYGIVVYCTHSHHLLNPVNIPLRNILIVEKSKSKKISLLSIDRFKSKHGKTNALQPVYEALDLPLMELFSDSSILLLVEGINDKYILEMFTKIPEGLRILPGTSADSILKNIPYMLAYEKKNFCLWDNDDEGALNQKRARKQFHINDELLLLLPLGGKRTRRMEDMLAEEDYDKLRKALSLNTSANYDLIVPTLFFTENRTRKKIIGTLAVNTTPLYP